FFDLLGIDPIHRTEHRSLQDIYRTIALIASVALCSLVGWRTCLWAVITFESRVMKDLTDSCFAYLQNHSHRFFIDNFPGTLVKRINRFAAAFEVVADQLAIEMGQTALRMVVFVAVVFFRNATLGCVFLAWTIAFICFNFFFARWKLKFDRTRAELDTKVTGR